MTIAVLMLAYGEFHSTSYWGMLAETIPFLLKWVIPPAILYVASSALAEYVRIHLIGITLYLLIFFLLAPQMVVLGAWGPAHVAADIGFWAWPLFFLLLLGKVLLLYLPAPRPCVASPA